jgi:hypothetical protein
MSEQIEGSLMNKELDNTGIWLVSLTKTQMGILKLLDFVI